VGCAGAVQFFLGESCGAESGGNLAARALTGDTGASISISIGRYHPGIRGLARSYQDARAALSLGCRFHGCNEVHCLKIGIAAFIGVSDQQTKIELATYLLSPLDHEPELLATLEAFCFRPSPVFNGKSTFDSKYTQLSAG